MNFLGLQKTTLLDYPGHVAATLFTGGCNFRCPFCHNMNLVMETDGSNRISDEEIFKFLIKRQGILDGICITGGEPTLQGDLYEFCTKVKEIGYLIKLDTNGTNPEILKKLVSEKCVDYIAMDIKSSMDNYIEVCGLDCNSSIKKVQESIEYLLSNKIDYEFRTTIIKEYHDAEVIKDIAELIKGAKAYYLQSFVDSEYVIDHSLNPVSIEELLEYKKILERSINKVEIRGVE